MQATYTAIYKLANNQVKLKWIGFYQMILGTYPAQLHYT